MAHLDDENESGVGRHAAIGLWRQKDQIAAAHATIELVPDTFATHMLNTGNMTTPGHTGCPPLAAVTLRYPTQVRTNFEPSAAKRAMTAPSPSRAPYPVASMRSTLPRQDRIALSALTSRARACRAAATMKRSIGSPGRRVPAAEQRCSLPASNSRRARHRGSLERRIAPQPFPSTLRCLAAATKRESVRL